MRRSGANKIIYDRRVSREDLPKLDKVIKERIRIAIETKLQSFPEKYGEPLHARLGRYWRLRVGDWRVIYEILRNEVCIRAIGHRNDIYKTTGRRLG